MKDDLTRAIERYDAAVVEQLRSAVAAHLRGEDVGIYQPAVTQFLRLRGAAA